MMITILDFIRGLNEKNKGLKGNIIKLRRYHELSMFYRVYLYSSDEYEIPYQSQKVYLELSLINI